MKLFKLFLFVLLGICFVQCDTAERRKSKAEDAIEKHLFEILDNYQSYEKISTEVDTLYDIWLTEPAMLEMGLRYLDAVNNGYDMDSKIERINKKIEGYKASIRRSAWYGNWRAVGLTAFESTDVYNELERATRQKQQNDSVLSDYWSRLNDMHRELLAQENTYWHVRHKFRYSENGQESRIRLVNYIFDRDMKEIIYSWDDDDAQATQMIDLVNDAKGDLGTMWAVTEDEQVDNEEEG